MTETAVKSNTDPEIDEELLAEAKRHLGTGLNNEAMNIALRELVCDRRARRLRAFDDLQRMADEGAFDFDALEEADR
jgi:Arc/MetJ family transcription regulator